MILVDTDHLTLLTNARAAAHEALLERLYAAPPQIIGVPIIAAEEQCRGWLAEIARHRDLDKQIHAYDQLAKLFEFLGEWEILRFDTNAAELFERLRKQHRRVGTQDLKIAAISLANEALLLSANLRDFKQVAGLRVENWLGSA